MLKENDLNRLTTEDVRDKLSRQYDRIRAQIAKHRDGPIADETGMAAYAKEYKGICGKCGEYGHHSITAGTVHRTKEMVSIFQ